MIEVIKRVSLSGFNSDLRHGNRDDKKSNGMQQHSGVAEAAQMKTLLKVPLSDRKGVGWNEGEYEEIICYPKDGVSTYHDGRELIIGNKDIYMQVNKVNGNIDKVNPTNTMVYQKDKDLLTAIIEGSLLYLFGIPQQ